MLPNTEDPPAAQAEQLANGQVALFVACDFEFPVLAAAAWNPAMPTTAMPEAAINEDCKTGVAKNEIGVAGKWLVPAPTSDSGGPENGGKS